MIYRLGRKFILALIAVLSPTLLMWFGKINDGVYSAVMIATIGAYLTANVMQKQVQKPATKEPSDDTR